MKNLLLAIALFSGLSASADMAFDVSPLNKCSEKALEISEKPEDIEYNFGRCVSANHHLFPSEIIENFIASELDPKICTRLCAKFSSAAALPSDTGCDLNFTVKKCRDKGLFPKESPENASQE